MCRSSTRSSSRHHIRHHRNNRRPDTRHHSTSPRPHTEGLPCTPDKRHRDRPGPQSTRSSTGRWPARPLLRRLGRSGGPHSDDRRSCRPSSSFRQCTAQRSRHDRRRIAGRQSTKCTRKPPCTPPRSTSRRRHTHSNVRKADSRPCRTPDRRGRCRWGMDRGHTRLSAIPGTRAPRRATRARVHDVRTWRLVQRFRGRSRC